MTNTEPTGEAALLTDVLDGFELDVRVIPEAVSDDGLVPCGTEDGCGSTCASACANSGC